jgi:acyl carrier protein
MQVSNVCIQIRDFVLKHFPLAGNQNLSNNDSLLEGGIIDSLGVLNLVTYIEQAFRISVSDEDLIPENFQTIEHISAFVQGKSSIQAGRLS